MTQCDELVIATSDIAHTVPFNGFANDCVTLQQASKTNSEPIEGDKSAAVNSKKKNSSSSVDAVPFSLNIPDRSKQIKSISINVDGPLETPIATEQNIKNTNSAEAKLEEQMSSHKTAQPVVSASEASSDKSIYTNGHSNPVASVEITTRKASLDCDIVLQVVPTIVNHSSAGEEAKAEPTANNTTTSTALDSSLPSTKSFKKHKSIKRFLKRNLDLGSIHSHGSTGSRPTNDSTTIPMENGSTDGNDVRLVKNMLESVQGNHNEEDNHGEWCPEIPFENVSARYPIVVGAN